MIVLQQQLKLERIFVFSAISELLYVYPFKFEEFKFANCHLPCPCTGLAVLKLDTSAANGSLSLDGQARESKQTGKCVHFLQEGENSDISLPGCMSRCPFTDEKIQDK